MTIEVNSIKIGSWEFDAFLTEDGDLGFTVYEKGKSGDDDDTRSHDIIVKNEDVLK